jgi:hypothetical protein
MRFNLLARTITVLALGPALAVTVAACSSSSGTSAATSPSSPAASAPASAPAASAPAGSPSAPAGSSSSGAVAQITANWEKFFSSTTTTAQKTALLQNGSTFASAISAFTSLPLASGIGAKVTKVVLNSSTKATVTYNITSSGGASLLSGQTGTSVYQGGGWKVGDASLCGLFKLIPGGSVPAACSSAG